MRRSLATLLLGAVVVTTACGGGQATREGSAKLETISSVRQFQEAFDADRGTPRLVILLSPT